MSSSGEHFGPYRILRELGAGGMGRVWLAERDDLDLPIVVKRIHSEHAEDSRFRRRLLREAEVAAGLEHPNVVRVLDTGVIDDQLYMAMEYVPGSSLAGILAASRPELLPVAPVLNAIAQACDGLAYVHRFCDPRSGRWLQLVHRDVSVDNLLVSYSGEVKLADFGIVKMADSTQTTSGVIMGKLGYMSPEQLRDEELDGRSDLYSLGVCLFELLAGRRPLPAHRGRSVMEAVLYDPPVPLEQLRQDLPPRLVALVTRLLAKDRKVRPRGGEEVAAELRALLAERDEPTLFPSKLLEAPPKNRAKPRLEPATEVERLAATKPQRLAGPAPAPGAPAPSLPGGDSRGHTGTDAGHGDRGGPAAHAPPFAGRGGGPQAGRGDRGGSAAHAPPFAGRCGGLQAGSGDRGSAAALAPPLAR
jgi:serine/threonine-protein kinase